MIIPGLLLGGVQSGKWYVDTIHSLYRKKYGSNTTPSYLALQVNFEPINALLPSNLPEAARLLEFYFNYFEELQVQPYILCNITLHESISYFENKPKNFISIAKLAQDATHNLSGTVTVLGTNYTMNHNYIPSLFPNFNIVKLPTHLQQAVDELRKIYYHTNHPEMAQKVYKALSQLDIDYFVIACTELAVAFSDAKMPLQVINLPELQCRYLINELI